MTERNIRCRFAPPGEDIICPNDTRLEDCIQPSAVHVVEISPDQADILGREGYVTQIVETGRLEWLDGIHHSEKSIEGKLLICGRVHTELAESIIQISGVQLGKGNQ